MNSEDEANCTYVSVNPSYVKTLMPRGYQSMRQDASVEVKMNISILALPVIDTANLLFTVDYVLNLRWYDERVNIQDLNNVSVLNTLNEDIVDQLWKPKLSFVNALGPYQTVYDDRVYAIVVKESNPQPVDLTKPKEGNKEIFAQAGREGQNGAYTL